MSHTYLPVKLRPFKDGPTDLPERLAQQFASNYARVSRDSPPEVAQRYASIVEATKAVAQGVRDAERSKGNAGRFYVTSDDRVIGVATYDQGTLWEHGSRLPLVRGRELASGPKLSMWLGGAACANRPPRLLPDLLELGAQMLFGQRAVLHGHPWVLVRPGQKYVFKCLRDGSNAFGGFEVVSQEMDLARVDGVRTPRFVLVARRPVGELPG